MQKSLRIKKSEEIASIVQKRDRVYCEFFTIYYKESTTKTRVAFSVSKKYGYAVERNRAKRVLRETLRPYILEGDIYVDLVVVAKPSLKTATKDELNSKMEYCYNLLKRKIKK